MTALPTSTPDEVASTAEGDLAEAYASIEATGIDAYGEEEAGNHGAPRRYLMPKKPTQRVGFTMSVGKSRLADVRDLVRILLASPGCDCFVSPKQRPAQRYGAPVARS